MKRDASEILGVVKARMVSAFKLEASSLKHPFHSSSLGLAILDSLCGCPVESCLLSVELIRWEGFLEVDPSFEIVRNEELFGLLFSLKMIAVKVTT